MATQSILRSGILSPTRASLQRTTSTRSILKRPGALPLSPFTASRSNQSSPLLGGSPHVKFLPSPSLVSTFTTHSARSYDRAPISVSPLERTYITSLDDFKLAAAPKSFRSIPAAVQQNSSPAITDFEDPRSPKVQPAAKQNLLRFAAFTNNKTPTRPSKSLASALASYPRSPFPSAPLEPSEQVNDVVAAGDNNSRPRAASLELPKRNKKGLTLDESTVIPIAPTPSYLGRSVFSPSINEDKVHAPLDLESRLSEAFWKAVSLEEESIDNDGDDEAMFTAMEYPASATTTTTAPHQIMYGNADGAVWSPAVPKPGAAADRIRESLMSPSKRLSLGGGGGGFVRKDFTAPTPNDPFAAFPSFTAAMEVDGGAIAYPSRVAAAF